MGDSIWSDPWLWGVLLVFVPAAWWLRDKSMEIQLRAVAGFAVVSILGAGGLCALQPGLFGNGPYGFLLAALGPPFLLGLGLVAAGFRRWLDKSNMRTVQRAAREGVRRKHQG